MTGTRWKSEVLCAALVAGLAVAAFPGVAATPGNASTHDAKPAATPKWSPSRSVWFRRTWGIEIVGVKPVASGYMLAFKYRVVDPAKAAPLNDRRHKAYVIDEATGTVLSVPAMENVGELRQGATPQADRIYFMVFGNPGRLVKPGGTVSIVAGEFRVDGLKVE